MTGFLSKCLPPPITRCHRAMETEQSCVGREVSQHHASASTAGPVDFTTSNNLSALSEKDKSPEAIVAKLFGKTESDLAMIKKSMRIAENVVLGPSTSANAIEPSTAAVEEQTDTHYSGETLLPRKLILGNPNDYMNNAAALANRLMMETSVNTQEKDSNQAKVILNEKDNQETTQVPKGTCLNEGRETRIHHPQSMDIQKDQHDENSDFQSGTTQVHKCYESKIYSQKSESENPSILSVLSNMAAEAGMEDVDTVASANSPVAQPISTSPKSSFPEICNDYVPVASNISFDYSIASLINNENSASKDCEDSVMGRERVNQDSSPTTKRQSDPSHGTTCSAEKPQLVSCATDIVSSGASSYPQDISMSNLGSNAPSTVTQVSHTVSSRQQGGQSLSTRQPISTTPPTMQSSSSQQQHRLPAQASQPVANSGALMHGASISTAPVSNVPQPSVGGSSAYQMPELNLPDLRELDTLSSIFSEPHIQQPHMMTWNNFNVAQPVPLPIQTHHGITTPHVPSPTLSQRSPAMQTSPSPTLSHQGPFTQPLQSPTLPHQGTIACPVPSPALSPHRSSGAPHGGMMAPPQMPQHNVNRLTMVQDQMNARQLNTGMSFTHSQQTALSNSMSTTQNQYYGNTTQPNQLAGYNTPTELVHWQNNQANAWRGPLGIGMQGREGYGQFHEFRIRPQRQQFNAMPHSHQNTPSSVYDINMGTQGQFPNVAMQTSVSNDNMTMELARFAMAEIQNQNMQSNMNSAMYQRPQMQAQNVQRPPIPQHPRTPTAANPPQRGIPLASFANRELSNKTRPGQQYNSARIGHVQNSIDNHGGKLPLQHKLPPVTRFQGHLQVRNPQYSQSMHSGLNRHQTPPMQNNQQPQFRSPQIAKRMPIPKQPVPTPTAQPSTSRSSIQQAPRPVQSSTTSSSRMPTTISTTTQKSNKAATPSAPSTSSSSDLDSQSLAALVVESVLKGHDTNHVEQQIRLVNELMKGKSSTTSTASSSSTTERSTSGSQDMSASHNKGVEPANSSSSTTPSSRRASSRSDSMPPSQTTPPPRSSDQTNLEQSSQLRKKPGRPQEMFVDLTADEIEPTATPTIQRRKNPDIDIHVFIEILNTKSQDLQFCILEKCLRNECQPKYLTRCHSTHNWWVYQSEKKNICPTSEDVTRIAKQIIHRSIHDKGYFREQMTAILQSQDLKRSKIFQALCTEKVHVVGRAFQRPKAQAGLLFLNAFKDFPPNGSLNMYLSATTPNNIIQKVARLTDEEQSRKKEPRVLVIEPIPDSAPTVQIEPEMPPNEPHRPPLSAEERYTLENQQPIVIEPPPTPAPIPYFANEDGVAPVVIEPQMPSQRESSIRQSQNDQQQVSNTDLLSQTPLVIAPPTTPKAPSPNKVQRKSPAAPNYAHAAQPNSSKQQDCDVMQPPSQMQVPGRKQTSSGVQGPPVSGYVPYSMPQSVLEVLNSNAPAHNQPELWQYQAQLQFNIQKQLQTQQKQQQDQQEQRLQAHQQLLMHHQRAPSPVQFMAMQRMLYMSQGGAANIQLPVVANISEQERPAGSQAILQGLVPRPTPFMGEAPLPIVLSKNPAVPDSVTEQHVPVPMSSTLEMNKPNSSPAQPQGEPRPASNNQEVTQDQMSAHLTVTPAANTIIKHANENNSPKGHPQQEKLDALGDGSGVDREFSSLDDFITMSTDIGREVCASVSSSIDGDKKEAETPCNEQPKSSLLENGLPENERDRMGKQSLRIQMKRIEDVYDSLGLKRLSKSRYRIKPTSSLMKPKRATVRRKFAVDDGIPLEDSDNDPAWEGISSLENSLSSHNSSTDEYSEDEEVKEEEEEEEHKRTCIRIKRPFSTSSDEDEVRNCDVYDSSSESPRKAVDTKEPLRRRKKRKWQIDSAINTGKSPGKEMSSDTCGESPVKVQRRKRRVIDSDDDSPFKKADPFFPPSPVENKSAQGSPSQPRPPMVLTPSMSRSEGNYQSDNETDARSISDVMRDVEAAKICPSMQPSVQVARLTPGEIHKNRKRKCRRMKKKRIIRKPSKHVENQQTDHPQPSQKSNNSSHHDSGSDTELCETESFDNTQQADSDAGVPPAKDLQSLPVAYDLEFFTNDELWDELQRRQDLISCICGMTFVDRKHYNLHRDLHDKVNPKKCAICCEVFHDWIEFTSHTYSTHNSM